MTDDSRVVAVVGDLFFKSKVMETAAQAGVPITFATTPSALKEDLAAGGVGLVIVDLGVRSIDPVEAIRAARAAGNLRTVAFVSHVDEAAQAKALEAGCDSVLPKSAFTRDLPRILMEGRRPRSEGRT